MARREGRSDGAKTGRPDQEDPTSRSGSPNGEAHDLAVADQFAQVDWQQADGMRCSARPRWVRCLPDGGTPRY